MFKLLFRFIFVFFVLAIVHQLSVTAQAAEPTAEIKAMRLWSSPESTRVVFDLSRPVEFRVFTLDNPKRIVLDVQKAQLKFQVNAVEGLAAADISGVRAGVRNGNDLRMVLDMQVARFTAKPKAFLLKPNDMYGHRLVVDIPNESRLPNVTAASNTTVEPVASSAVTTPQPNASQTERRSAATGRNSVRTPQSRAVRKQRLVIVAIDAGHGGEDPGAVGPKGTREKDVVLALARRIANRMNTEPGMRAVLVRNGDYYVGLKKRMQIAREHQADLFLSIHADAFHQAQVRGSSVYVLSQRGASSQAAKWLAARQNAADLIGGVRLADKDDELAEVLLDLSQTATMSASYDAAKLVLGEIGGVNKLHKRTVQDAGFVVLKSPDVPSMLIETAFLSNPHEEKNLLSKDYQNRLAAAITSGVKQYFYQQPPADSLIASWTRQGDGRVHVTARGETLGGIAQRYGVSLAQLRALNSLNGDMLRVGQKLKIPVVQGSVR